MRIAASLLPFLIAAHSVLAQGTVPTFRVTAGSASFTLAGRDPAAGGATTIPVLLVPVALSFESSKAAGKPFVMEAAPDVPAILRSPVFSAFPFPAGGNTQYGDAMLRSMVAAPESWHTLLGKPEVRAVRIAVPRGSGYILTSHKTGRSLGIVDLEFLQKELFRRIAKQDGRLVIAVTRNVAYYALGDATVCCGWGTHGVDSATGNSFVLGSYLRAAPPVVQDADIQPLTQQVAQFFKDPLHDPLWHGPRNAAAPGNVVPAWMRSTDPPSCGGPAVSSTYFLLEPTDTNPKNNLPASRAFAATLHGAQYHLQNVALLPWYTGGGPGLGKAYSFPDSTALTAPAAGCPQRGGRSAAPAATASEAAPEPRTGAGNGHELIGYWTGYAAARQDISPQWDVVIVAFATPDHNAPEGTMQFRTPANFDAARFKDEIARLKSQGRKVLISLGGGGQYFTMADPNSVPNFVSSVSRIVTEYGFDGIDIDFETPSLTIDPGDTDFRHPRTPSIVHLIAGMRELRERLGPRFLITLVPEGTQIPAGHASYGGQFGSYLPIAHALRDILTFMDVQDYNTPPLEALDGEIYQPGTVDYHAAMTELVLRGFHPGGDSKEFWAGLPPQKVAVGFLTTDTTPEIVRQAMDYLITGRQPAGSTYKLRQPGGYPGLIGAMFWTLDADRRANYNFSNVIGPQLHALPPAR